MAVTGTEAAIEDALLWKLSQLVLSPVLPIAQPNVQYDPGEGQAYAMADFIVAPPLRLALGSNHTREHTGILQLNLFSPIGRGEIGARQVASAILNHFTEDAPINRNGVTVRVTERGTAGSARIDGPMIVMSIGVPWTCFA